MKLSLLTFIASGTQHEADLQAQINHLTKDLAITDYKVMITTFHQLLEYLSSHASPDILIVDVNSITQSNIVNDDESIEALNQLAEVCEPGTKVILIGQEIPLAKYRQLLDLGIEEYLSLPINYDALIHSVKQGLGLSSNLRAQNNKNIIISGLQGGVGSTTLTVALAQKLAQLGSHTLLADADTELGDLALFWPEIKQQAIPLEQLLELNNLERISQTLIPRLNYLAIDTSDASISNNIEPVRQKFSELATATLWDIPRHHNLANSLWQQADICIWVLESSVSVLHHWNSIKKQLAKNSVLQHESNTRHIFVLNQTRKERSQQIAPNKLQQALQQPLITLPYAGQQALDAANLGQASLLLNGKYGEKVDEICAHILTRSKTVKKETNPLQKLLRALGKSKSKRVAL